MSGGDHPAKRRLPIGIQTFREIREEGHYYADKTPHIERLVEQGKHYFLSRPRRFGKSLLLDTIKELFEGSEELFRGLRVHGRWDWGAAPSGGAAELRKRQLLRRRQGRGARGGTARRHRRRSGHRPGGAQPGRPFQPSAADLARTRRRARGHAGGRIRQADPGRAGQAGGGPRQPGLPERAVRSDQGLRRPHPLHAADRRQQILQGEPVLGAEQSEGHHARPAPRHDLRLHRGRSGHGVRAGDGGPRPEQVRAWYNGHSWDGGERVYNPFDILLLFDSRRFRAWWFETGTPTFLVDTLVRRGRQRLRARRPWSPTTPCCRVSTWGRSPPRRCCSRPGI